MSLPAAYQINGQTVSAEAFYAAACDPARSIAVEACAGAGKTWMLVARVVRALLEGTNAQDILAITFTKKAAGEMRGRLNAELRRCAALNESALVATLQSWGYGGSEALRRAPELRSLQARVSAQGRQVQLRTFHSWFSSLLRGAPLAVLQELGLPLSYELLEDDKKALPLVWPRFYAALAGSDTDKTAFFDSVARHGRHQTLKALEKALEKRVEFTLADAAGVAGGSVRPFGEQFPEMAGLGEPESAVTSVVMRESLWAAARVLGAAAAPSFSAKGVELEKALTEGRWPGVCEALLTKDGEARKFGTKIADIELVREAQERVQRVLLARRQHDAWLHQQRMVRLARVLIESYTSLKRERGWVDMNDLESVARRLLGDAELSGWMQQRLDARVRHLLIDEFQDTNPLQWQALYGWLSAYAGAGPGEAPGVFLVGDPKQSIYRFRRAEPQVFKAAQAFVVQGLGGALLSCDHTRRCAPAVVQALNVAMLDAVQAGEYQGFREHTTHSTAAGAVLALPAIERPAKDEEPADDGEEPVWRDSLGQPRVLPEEEGSAEREAAQAADWIAAQVAQGAKPDGFMVLARKRSRLRLMHEALRGRGIASEAPGETMLHESPAVQDLIALLDALVSPRHHLSLARALKSPLFGWSDGDLVSLATAVRAASPRGRTDGDRPAPGWWDVMRQLSAESGGAFSDGFLQRAQATGDTLDLYRGWLHRLPPHDALSAIYDHADVLARFAASVSASERGATLACLRDLLAQSLAQDGGRFLTPYRFVRALKAGGIAASDAHHTGAVRLLTIHGAKGLEADTVLLLDTDSPPQSTESMGVLVDWPAEEASPRRFVFVASEKTPPACADDLLAAERLARSVEELNALYVALTRAEHRLVLSSFVPHRTPDRSWWRRLLALAEPQDAPPGGDVAAQEDQGFGLAALPVLRPELAPGATPAPPAAEADEHTRIGRALHRLLQWRSTTAVAQDWGGEHVRAVAREFDLSPTAADAALAMARRVVGGEAAWAWDAAALSSWGNEVEIWHGGELLRMDRLVQRRDSGQWWVLDYKSAERPELQEELRGQMRRYHQALRSSGVEGGVRLAFINAAGRLIELESP